MATIRKTITLTEVQDSWIKAQIAGGAYTNESEVLRDLIRKAQQQDAAINAVRAALVEGEHSGRSARDPEGIRAAVKARRSTGD